MIRLPTSVLCAALLVGCQSTGSVNEVLDTQSGLTLVTDSELAVFARTQGQYSRSARDYLYLAPVEVNERGLRQYYLWIGLASTIDREFLAVDGMESDLLVLDIDGAPMEFELAAWDERLPQLAGRVIYEPAVAPASVMTARVTLDQLTRITEAEVDEISVGNQQNVSIAYSIWRGHAAWPAFLDRAGGR
jgi:hypothetical protein